MASRARAEDVLRELDIKPMYSDCVASFWSSKFGYVSRFAGPPITWVMFSRFLPRELLGVSSDSAAENFLSMTSNFLAAVGLLYAIYLGFTFQSAIDRVNGLQRAISAEVSAITAIVELCLSMDRPTEAQREEVMHILVEYVAHVLRQELLVGQRPIELRSPACAAVVHRLFGALRVFKEVASDGAVDVLDLRTVDALHDELRAVLRERSERMRLTNARMPRAHWAVLMFLSLLTIAGVAMGDVAGAPFVSGALTCCVGIVIPLTYTVVADMSSPFHGSWRIDTDGFKGLLQFTLPMLLRAPTPRPHKPAPAGADSGRAERLAGSNAAQPEGAPPAGSGEDSPGTCALGSLVRAGADVLSEVPPHALDLELEARRERELSA